jgi:CubicO group peptidase (beta-lactamase class C family)
MRMIERMIRSIAMLILLFAPLTMSVTTPQSQSTTDLSGQVSASDSHPQGPTDRAELESFLDGVIAAQMRIHHIPGATLVVVKDGEVFVAKDYGYADLKSHRPVVADETIFRIASVSKLFTWTAVMQLAEAGKLDLDADINTYLKDFQIPATYLRPITLKNLMSHTAGFESRGGLWARDTKDLLPLGKYLADNIPARVRPPGEMTAYSNYGGALAGYIVEQVSGMPFEQYIQEYIYEPLGMHHSTFRQPVPPELAANLAVGYTYAGGQFQTEGFEYIQTSPASSMSSTATDMSKFMIAHLQDGRYGDARILQETTAQQMHKQLFTNDPRISGMAYGFMEMQLNNQRILVHSGSIIAFQSLLALVPGQNLGLFVAYNSDMAFPAPEELLTLFLDHYYPIPAEPDLQVPAGFEKRAGQVLGQYALTQQIPCTTYEKMGALLIGCHVTVAEPGYLITDCLSADPKRWVEVAPLSFREVGGQGILVFRADARGRITNMFFGNDAGVGYVKLPWYATTRFNGLLLLILVMLFLSSLVLWPRRRHEAGMQLVARWLLVGTSGLNMIFLVNLVIALSDMRSIAYYGLTPLLRTLLLIPLTSTIFTAGVLVCALWAWAQGYWSTVWRIHYTLVTLAAITLLWQLSFWNLLRFYNTHT